MPTADLARQLDRAGKAEPPAPSERPRTYTGTISRVSGVMVFARVPAFDLTRTIRVRGVPWGAATPSVGDVVWCCFDEDRRAIAVAWEAA